MLEPYFIKPQTLDRIRHSWLSEPIENYVIWLTERGYAARNVYRRVPILMHFAEFAGARRWLRGGLGANASPPSTHQTTKALGGQ